IEPESDSERLARRCACLADAREEEAERCAAMGPSLFPWGPRKKPRHDDKRRSHVLGQFPQGRPPPSPYQTTTPSTSHPNSSSALGGILVPVAYFAGAYGAFSEDALYGLLYITIPLYTAYYLVTRWEDLWIWVTCATVGVGLVLLGTEMVRWAG